MRLRLSVPHYLADEDDVDAPGQLGVDLQELPDGLGIMVDDVLAGLLAAGMTVALVGALGA